jgi:type I restriction enzyme M protein
MIHQLGDNGTLACVLPHGVLFRGAAEGMIRKYLINDLNYIDAIIGLPANIFYGTSIPTCILVVKKCRTADDNILFIDASQHFEKQGNQNVLTDYHVEKIIETYRLRQEEEKYSHLATLQEISENDFNLNIPRYVNTFEEEDQIDINEVAKELRELEKSSEEIDKKIADFCKELNIEMPFNYGI